MQEKLLSAFAKQQAGKLREAAETYREILRMDSSHPDALHLLGLIESKEGNHDRAVQLIEQAVAAMPSSAVMLSNLGVVLRQAGRINAAIEAYEKSIQLDPNNADAYFNLGKSLKLSGKIEEAAKMFRKSISISPTKPSPWQSLIASVSEVDLPQAIQIAEQAIGLFPSNADLYLSLGALHRRSGNLEKTIEAYRRAVALAPTKVEPLTRLAAALISAHDLEEGKKYLSLAQTIEPESVHVLNSLGLLHNTLGNSTAAIDTYRRAIELYPSYGTAHSNLSSALRKLGHISESLLCVQRGLELEPKNVESRVIEGGAFMSLGRIEEAEESFRNAIQARKGYRDAHDGLLMCLQYQSRQTIESIYKEHQVWNSLYNPYPKSYHRPNKNLQTDRPLRIGFVSADIGAHPVGYFTYRLFDSIDRDQFTTTVYSDRIGVDPFLEKIKSRVNTWRETVSLSDRALEAMIVDDDIDILFDMAGHTAQNRLMVFAKRVAPIQISWAGYVGTTGLAQMDYLLADRFHVPVESEPYYSEQILRMPDGYVTYQPPDGLPDVTSLPCLTNGFITFAAMANPAKVNPVVLDLWSEILRALPNSRLLLCYSGWPDEGNRKRVLDIISKKGCQQQIFFEHYPDAKGLMARYGDVDIALDTTPYSGGLTTCEAMWMGVPTITLPSDRFASRHSFSHLSNVGLEWCIASSPADYVQKAIELAQDCQRLTEIREKLRDQMARSPLCDGPRFARNFERLMRECWTRYIQSVPAQLDQIS